MKLYNTRTRKKEVFTPLDASNVRMYVCGPTVYDFAHIGNARPIIVFDVLFRLLRHIYGADHVTYARNITDVDDKINARAVLRYPEMAPEAAIRKLTEETTAQFHKDVAALGCLPPTHEPRATDYIEQMKDMITALYEADIAYVAEDHVLFSVADYGRMKDVPEYGSLARRSLDEMVAGARVEVAPYKRDAMDFVLWKPSKPGEPGWPSPLNIGVPGRPGWHLECSAMSKAILGDEFDIHGGGIDLVFPHHENEVAQSCAANNTPMMANVWMHNGFLQVEGQKMSKSLGNFFTINELVETKNFGGRNWRPEAIRLAMLKTHYRQPIDWTVKALEEAEIKIDRYKNALAIFGTGKAVDPPFSVMERLLDDLNVYGALSEMDYLNSVANGGMRAGDSECESEVIKTNSDAADKLRAALFLLGIELPSSRGAVDELFEREVNTLIEKRLLARKANNWAEADRIRGNLAERGIALKDAKDPETGEIVTTWEIAR
ncbi:MAG: cysteine--tRNA ligase [Rhodomicrobium sp.]|nr:cysteine--tRNA ligase [Rhodomicrobium sp.]